MRKAIALLIFVCALTASTALAQTGLPPLLRVGFW
jgi:hypothetical protein